MLHAEARHAERHYDLVHSHYWLSGQVGWLTADRWDVPLVHSMHTMAKVKNAALAEGDTPEPAGRVIGEQQVVEAADRLVANTDAERGRAGRPLRRGPREGRRRPAGGRPGDVHRPSPAGPLPAPGWGCPRTPRCCCSSGASSP